MRGVRTLARILLTVSLAWPAGLGGAGVDARTHHATTHVGAANRAPSTALGGPVSRSTVVSATRDGAERQIDPRFVPAAVQPAASSRAAIRRPDRTHPRAIYQSVSHLPDRAPPAQS
jgi:hypothetical protein